MVAVAVTVTTQDQLKEAYDGSYYTISGAGGEITEWISGLTKILKARDIGTPVKWLVTTGAAVNRFAGPKCSDSSYFPEDLSILMFGLEGLNIGNLAWLKLEAQDRWFDDVIQNMRNR